MRETLGAYRIAVLLLLAGLFFFAGAIAVVSVLEYGMTQCLVRPRHPKGERST